MTTTLQRIHDLVASHEAAWASANLDEGDVVLSVSDRQETKLINEHEAVTLLSAVLPLLTAAVNWQSQPDDTTMYMRIINGNKLERQIAKLTVDTSAPAASGTGEVQP